MKTISGTCMIQCVRFMFLLCLIHLAQVSYAQVNKSGKLSPKLAMEVKAVNPDLYQEFFISIKGGLPNDLKHIKVEKVYQFNDLSVFRVLSTYRQLDSFLLSLPSVIFVERGNRKPVEEMVVGNLDLSVNKINLVHRNFPSVNGDGIVVSVKENRPDTTDIDFKGRFLSTNLSSTTLNSHATIMSTIIGGGGNSWHLGKGAAWGSTISSSSYAVLFPDANNSYQQYNISVQNHSYGVGVENYYAADAAAYDASAMSNPSLLHVFSSGNSGSAAATTGTYTGLNGFANITGSFKMAKNILTVGATDSFSNVAVLSSKGPAHDGRVKPELVAFGEDGSSGSAALVSGTILLLQQAYKQVNGSLPQNSLVKSILINSADDVGNAEVDYKNGYGALNANNAMKTFKSNRFFGGSITNSGNQAFSIVVPSGVRKLKATLVWNDPPVMPNASKALINDLDLEMINISTGQVLKPWVLNSFPHIDSLNQLAKRGRDSLNNIEQITIDDPVPGTYQLKVTGFNVTTASQSFHLAWQLDTIDTFEWQYPTSNDFIFPSTVNNIRWQSSFAAATGILEYTTNGTTWQQIQNPINLSTGHFYWNVPAMVGIARLRMTIGTNVFVSDSFTIADRTTTEVGFNCPDSFLIYWDKLPSVSNYRVYRLGDKYQEPLTITSDSFLIVPKAANPSLHYSVAPLIGTKEGVRSYTFNYSQQGVECYVKSLLAFLAGNNSELTLTLGSLYSINKTIFEKFDGAAFVPIDTILNPSSLVISYADLQTTKGLNIYRAKIELNGGRVIYSPVATVYNFNGTEFIVYPNPAGQYQPVTVLSNNMLEPATLQVFTMHGQMIYEMQLNDLINQIPGGKLSKGIHLLRIIRKDQKDVVLKLFVQ